MKLNDLLSYLTYKGNLTINLHDVTGILSAEMFETDRRFRMHTARFCDIAKSTSGGYMLCVGCKRIVCKRALRRGKYFFGMCPYGLTELVYPIHTEGKVSALLFVGNQTEDIEKTKEKAKKACKRTGVCFERLSGEFCNIHTADREYMLKTAKLIEEFMRILYKENGISTGKRCHGVVEEIKQRAEEHYDCRLTLKQMSELYFMNEKYLGRLFLRQTGYTFHEYLNKLRLEAAEGQIANSDKSITEIALECGFNSISYFNRTFFEKNNITPSGYRKKLDRH